MLIYGSHSPCLMENLGKLKRATEVSERILEAPDPSEADQEVALIVGAIRFGPRQPL